MLGVSIPTAPTLRRTSARDASRTRPGKCSFCTPKGPCVVFTGLSGRPVDGCQVEVVREVNPLACHEAVCDGWLAACREHEERRDDRQTSHGLSLGSIVSCNRSGDC